MHSTAQSSLRNIYGLQRVLAVHRSVYQRQNCRHRLIRVTKTVLVAGYLVIPDFASVDETVELRQRALQLVDGFEPSATSVFSTKNQVLNTALWCDGRQCTILFLLVSIECKAVLQAVRAGADSAVASF